MRYHLTPVRMAIINKQRVLERVWGKGTCRHCWWECRLMQPLWEMVWRFFEQFKIKLPYDPAIPLLGMQSKTPQTLIQMNISTPMFTAALFTIAELWKQPKCPSIDERIKKWWYYKAIKKNKILLFRTLIDIEGIMLSEISWSEKDKDHMISLICGI